MPENTTVFCDGNNSCYDIVNRLNCDFLMDESKDVLSDSNILDCTMSKDILIAIQQHNNHSMAKCSLVWTSDECTIPRVLYKVRKLLDSPIVEKKLLEYHVHALADVIIFVEENVSHNVIINEIYARYYDDNSESNYWRMLLTRRFGTAHTTYAINDIPKPELFVSLVHKYPEKAKEIEKYFTNVFVKAAFEKN